MAANFNCNVSSSSSVSSPSSSPTPSLNNCVAFVREFGVVAEFFNGDARRVRLRRISSYLCLPLGELRRASRGDFGGHEVSTTDDDPLLINLYVLA
jgi:hypothetical protein